MSLNKMLSQLMISSYSFNYNMFSYISVAVTELHLFLSQRQFAIDFRDILLCDTTS